MTSSFQNSSLLPVGEDGRGVRPSVQKDYTSIFCSRLRIDFAENLPDPGHPVPLAIAGNSDPIFDVMTDTAKPGVKAQIAVDGRVLRNVTQGQSKRRLFAD